MSDVETLFVARVQLFLFHEDHAEFEEIGSVRCVIQGSAAEQLYKLGCLDDDSGKYHCTAVIKANNQIGACIALQGAGYVAFKDEQGKTWSMLFPTNADAIEFVAHVTVAMYSAAGSPDTSIIACDAVKGKKDRPIFASNKIKVRYQSWAVQRGGIPGCELSKLGRMLESNDADEKPYMLTVPANHVSVTADMKGFEGMLVGACEESQRFILVPQSVKRGGGPNCHMCYFVWILRKKDEPNPPPPPPPPPASAFPVAHLPVTPGIDARDLQAKLLSVTTERDELLKKLTAAEIKVTALAYEADELKEKKMELRQLQAELSNSTSERNALRKELTDAKQESRDLLARAERLADTLTARIGERDAHMQELAAAKTQGAEAEMRGDKLDADLRGLRFDFELLTQRNITLEAEAAALGQKLDADLNTNPEAQFMRSKIPPGRVDCFALAQLQDVRELGSGGFGSVMLVRVISTNRLLAMKIPFSFHQLQELRMSGTLTAVTSEVRSAASRDFLIASRIRHPHVVPFAGLVGTMEEPIGMLMEYVDGGSLYDAIVKPGRKPSVSEFLRIAVHLASAVAHLHTHGVWHRDIKPQNVLIDSSGHIYLADFGSASRGDVISDATVTMTANYAALTPKYLDPERNREGPGDVYALGLTLLEVCLGTSLHTAQQAGQLIYDELSPMLQPMFERLLVRSKALNRDTANSILKKIMELQYLYAPYTTVGSAWTEDIPGAWLPLGSSTTVFPLQHLPPALPGRIPVVSLCSSLSPTDAGDLLRALPALLPAGAPVIRDLGTPANLPSGVVLLVRNAVLEGSFEARMRLLRSRSTAYYDANGKSCTSWKEDTLVDGSKTQQHTPDVLGHRDAVMARLNDRVWKPFPANVDGDPVRVALLFHATTLEAALQIADAGFMSYARLDSGYFGKGLYFTPDFAYARDEYAANMMSDGKRVAIIAAYVCMRHVFPCVDMTMLGKSNRGGYDAHAAVVSPDYKYKPVTKGEWNSNWNGVTSYLEVVVFDCAQALPAAMFVL